MALPSLFDICTPRKDVLSGAITESDFAADLAQVLRGDAPDEYKDPVRFFENTHPTRGLKSLLRNVCLRLTGRAEQVSSIFRLDTNYGGGKTHALIALVHAAKGMPGVPNTSEFIEPDILPTGKVRVAAFDGENADPYNGYPLEEGLRAYTPWGQIAHALAGKAGYEKVRRSDEALGAPGAETIKELFGGEPTLILLDELSIYLRKLGAKDLKSAGGQVTAFLTALFKAVESTPNAVVVYTLAIGKGGQATDAYSSENQYIADAMAEAESVSARKAALLDPTEEDETVKVLRRRLFSHVDDAKAAEVVEAYRQLWEHNKDLLPSFGARENLVEAFRNGFPLHPELIRTFTDKTSTLVNFQRVRGMLRLLARSVARLWEQKPKDAFALHLHHLDLGYEPIRQEVVTRLGQNLLVPAIRADVAGVDGDQPSLAQELDSKAYPGMPPFGSYVGRVILFHTLAFNESLKGLAPDELRYAIVSPGTDISFVDDAKRRFVQDSAYLDDRQNAPLRFLTEANLTQIIRRQEQQVDKGEVRAQLNDRITSIFGGRTFALIPFPGPYDVPEDSGDSTPMLAVIGYDAEEVSSDNVVIPPLVASIYHKRGASGELRTKRNNIVFLVVDAERKEHMRKQMVRRLALEVIRQPERLKELSDHQREKVNELFRRSEQEVAVAIQQAYRHVFYPSRIRLADATLDLGYTVIETESASTNPGAGQVQVIRVLRDNNKLRLPEDDPDLPTYIRDRTPLKKGVIATAALREEYRRDPALPMLVGHDVFVKSIRQGIETGEFIYQSGELVWAKGEPPVNIKIDEQCYVWTATAAKEKGIWPKPAPAAPTGPDSGTSPEPGGAAPGPQPGAGTGVTPGGSTTPPPPTDTTLSEEGVLKEALTKLWERARSNTFKAISKLTLRVFDPGDAFKMLGLVAAIAKAEKQVSMEGGYETTEGSELHVEYEGNIDDAQPLKDFLDPQLRAASTRDLKVGFHVVFTEGLSLGGEEPEKLSERLCRFGIGAAYVEAVAEKGE